MGNIRAVLPFSRSLLGPFPLNSLTMRRLLPAAEQAAHTKSVPRRRCHELLGFFVTHGDFGTTTHLNCSPIIPARFSRTERALLNVLELATVRCLFRHR